MFARVKQTLQGIFFTPEEHEEARTILEPRFPYRRPNFLHLNTQDLEICNNHIVRPIVTPSTDDALPWMAGYAECVNSGKSTRNEDQATVYQFCLPGKYATNSGLLKGICEDIPITYYAVFDGHEGTGAALHASQLLHKIIEKNFLNITQEIWEEILVRYKYKNRARMSRHVNLDDLISGLLEQAFLEMDDIIGQDRHKYSPGGGCSALVILMFLYKVYVANAGNCRAIHCNENLTPEPLSVDMFPSVDVRRITRLAQLNPSLLEGKYTWQQYIHKPKRSDVGKLILYKDGWSNGWLTKKVSPHDLMDSIITGKGKQSRLLNTIGVTRGFGNHDLINKSTKVAVKPLLSARCQVVRLPLDDLDMREENVLIMATDGLWETISNDDVSALANKMLNGEEKFENEYMALAKTLVLKARGEPSGEGWTVNKKIISGDDVSVFVIPLIYQKECADFINYKLIQKIGQFKETMRLSKGKTDIPETSQKSQEEKTNFQLHSLH